MAGLKVGQIAGKAEFDAARDRLAGCGAFETVSYRFTPGPNGGYAAVLQLSEVQQVYPVEFEDLHVSLRELTAVLEAKDPLFTGGKLPATHPVMARYEKWLQEFLASKGIEEKIAGNVRPAQPGEYAIVFHPVRNLPAVAQITFEGNNVIPQNTCGRRSRYRNRRALHRRHLPPGSESSIRPLTKCAAACASRSPRSAPSRSRMSQGCTFSSKWMKARATSWGRSRSRARRRWRPEALLKAGDFKTGDVANHRAGERRAGEDPLSWFAVPGYLEAKVTSERKIDDTNKKVDVAVHVEAGPQFTMGKLTIAGLDLNAEAEMRRIWG